MAYLWAGHHPHVQVKEIIRPQNFNEILLFYAEIER